MYSSMADPFKTVIPGLGQGTGKSYCFSRTFRKPLKGNIKKKAWKNPSPFYMTDDRILRL